MNKKNIGTYRYCMLSDTIKGGSRRAEKSCKVLMMMIEAAKLGWAGPGAEQGRKRAGAGQELAAILSTLMYY